MQEGQEFKASLCNIYSKLEASLHYPKPDPKKQTNKKIPIVQCRNSRDLTDWYLTDPNWYWDDKFVRANT